MIASNTFCANKHIKLMNLDYIMHGTAVFFCIQWSQIMEVIMQGHQINIWSNNAWSPQCLCTTLDVFSKSTSGSMCPLLAASWQLSLATDETFLRWELSHYCEVIKDYSICSLVPLLSFLIDLSQALGERAALSKLLSSKCSTVYVSQF